MAPSLSHGPTLPYRIVAGVVPCRAHWLVVSAKLQGVAISVEDPRVFDSLADVLDEKPAFTVIGLFAPIGYLDAPIPKGRECDREARKLLGNRRSSAIRSAPSWISLEESAEVSNGQLDAVTKRLLPRYLEVATEMAPYRQRVVFAVHPELSFFQLNEDRPLTYAKRFDDGRTERRRLLEMKIPGVERILDAELPGVSRCHLLDAAACLWTARRIVAQAATRMPADPEWDNHGLRMEIVR